MAMTEAQRAVMPRDLVILNDMRMAEERGDTEAYIELRSQLEVPIGFSRRSSERAMPTSSAKSG